MANTSHMQDQHPHQDWIVWAVKEQDTPGQFRENYRCSSCGLLFSYPRPLPIPDELVVLPLGVTPEPGETPEEILDRLDLGTDGSPLDLGALSGGLIDVDVDIGIGVPAGGT